VSLNDLDTRVRILVSKKSTRTDSAKDSKTGEIIEVEMCGKVGERGGERGGGNRDNQRSCPGTSQGSSSTLCKLANSRPIGEACCPLVPTIYSKGGRKQRGSKRVVLGERFLQAKSGEELPGRGCPPHLLGEKRNSAEGSLKPL